MSYVSWYSQGSKQSTREDMLCGLEAQDIYFLIPYSNMLFYFYYIPFYGNQVCHIPTHLLIVTDDKGKIKIS